MQKIKRDRRERESVRDNRNIKRDRKGKKTKEFVSPK
jgi:hypothetical protein